MKRRKQGKKEGILSRAEKRGSALSRAKEKRKSFYVELRKRGNAFEQSKGKEEVLLSRAEKKRKLCLSRSERGGLDCEKRELIFSRYEDMDFEQI